MCPHTACSRKRTANAIQSSCINPDRRRLWGLLCTSNVTTIWILQVSMLQTCLCIHVKHQHGAECQSGAYQILQRMMRWWMLVSVDVIYVQTLTIAAYHKQATWAGRAVSTCHTTQCTYQSRDQNKNNSSFRDPLAQHARSLPQLSWHSQSVQQTPTG